MEQLNSLDASFVDAEDQDQNASFAIASIAVFEGPAPSYEEFLACDRAAPAACAAVPQEASQGATQHRPARLG